MILSLSREICPSSDARLFGSHSFRLSSVMGDVDVCVDLPDMASRSGAQLLGSLHGRLKVMPEVEKMNPSSLYSKSTLELTYSGVPVDITYSNPGKRDHHLGQQLSSTIRNVTQGWSSESIRCVMMVQLLGKCTGVVQPKGYPRGRSFKSVHMVLLCRAAWNDHPPMKSASVGAQILYLLRWFIKFPFQAECVTVDIESFAVARRIRRDAAGREFGLSTHGAVIACVSPSNRRHRSWNICSNTLHPEIKMFQRIMDEVATKVYKCGWNPIREALTYN